MFGYIFAMFPLAMIVTSPIAGFLTRRMGGVLALSLGEIILGFATAGFGYIPPDGVYLVFIARGTTTGRTYTL